MKIGDINDGTRSSEATGTELFVGTTPLVVGGTIGGSLQVVAMGNSPLPRVS